PVATREKPYLGIALAEVGLKAKGQPGKTVQHVPAGWQRMKPSRARRVCHGSEAHASTSPGQTQPCHGQKNELQRRNSVQHRARFRSPLQVHTFLRMQ